MKTTRRKFGEPLLQFDKLHHAEKPDTREVGPIDPWPHGNTRFPGNTLLDLINLPGRRIFRPAPSFPSLHPDDHYQISRFPVYTFFFRAVHQNSTMNQSARKGGKRGKDWRIGDRRRRICLGSEGISSLITCVAYSPNAHRPVFDRHSLERVIVRSYVLGKY